MADKLLTTISVLENFPTGQFAKGDTIKSYFDTVTREIDVTITSGGGTYPLPSSSATSLPSPSEIIKSKFNKETGEIEQEITTINYWSRSQTGYKFSEVTVEPTTSSTGLMIITSFTTTRNYPYMTKNTTSQVLPRIDVPPPPNDISLVVTSRTLATNQTTADGQIEVTADGTNTPFTYYDTDPSSGGTDNGSGTFIGLLPGNYRFYAKDSAGYQTRVETTLGYKEVPDIDPNNNIIDNYGVRWSHQQLTYDGETYKTEIFERNYTGSVNEVKGAITPFSLSRRTEGDSFIDMNILYTSCQVNLTLESENQFRDIVLGDDKKYIVLRSKYNGSTYDTQWKGFVTPESYQDVLFQPPYYVSIEASDRLGDLKYLDFRYGNDDLISGTLSQLKILDICLSKILFNNGYRIACNIFASGHTTSSRTPLDQTYVDTKKYRKDDEPFNCEDVVLDILTTYQAVLFCEGDFWYVVRKEEWVNTTINYVEYDSTLAISTTGSWSPRVQIKSPTEGTRGAWINGAQSRVYTPQCSNIELKVETGLVENNSITPEFKLSNAVFGSSGFQGFGSWLLYSVDDTVDVNRVKSINNGEFVAWEIGTQASINSSTYTQLAGNINYDGGDEITLKVELNVFGYYTSDGLFGLPKIDEYPPYLQFKWSLKIDNKWVSASGKYSSDEKLNYHYFERLDDFHTFEKTISLPEGASTSSTYQLRFYAVDISEADLEQNYVSLSLGDSDIFSAINKQAAINNAISIIGGAGFKTANVRKRGDRLVARIGNDFYYYELFYAESRVTSTIEKVMAYAYNPDTNPYAWELIKIVSLPYQGISEGYQNKEYCVAEDCNTIRNGLVTTTLFKQMDLIIESVGNAVTEELIIERVSNENNNIDKTYNISSFDLGNFNKSLYVNYLRLADGTPTKKWTPTGGITTSIQNHVLRFLSKYSRVPRSRLNGNFRTDGVNFTSINVLVDTLDGSKLYISTGLSSDDKLQEFSGELLEIAAGDDVTISAFTDGFLQTAIR